MAADQIKKRFSASSSLVACTSGDQNRVKRKRLEEPLHQNLKTRPTISLEWDSKKNGVVSRRDQIGISQRHMSQVVSPVPNGHKVLADVLSVPQEIFQLENLSEILSYEVWQSHLPENERSFLSQFLPKENDPDTVVRDLLDGNNIHFGNPLLDWGTSLCSGKLHPDNVLHKEQSLKACKKSYHLNLQNYHNDMIENLETWKEKWVSCNDPEAEIVQKMWRSRKHAQKSLLPPETRFYTEENYVATPESANSEKVESQNRKRLLNKKSESSSSGLKVVSIPNQGEKVHKRNIQNEDGAKYMSYIKVSKEQHDRVKSSMKHTGNSIRPRSLNNVLGSIDALNVQPFERFEEEERSNIHNYWLKLANGDIPGYVAAWKSRQLQRQQVTWSLGEEIKVNLEQVEINEAKEKECRSDDMVMEPPSENNCLEVLPVEDVNKEQQSTSLLEQDQMDDIEAIHEMTTDMEDVSGRKDDYVFEEQKHDDTIATEEDDEVREHVQEDCNEKQHNPSSLNHSATMVSDMIEPPTKSIFLKAEQDQQQIPPLCPISNNPHVINNPVEMQQSHCSGASAKTGGQDASPLVSEYHHIPENVDISANQGRQGKSDVWAAAGEVHHGSYYQSPTQELSPIGHPQFIQEQQQQPPVQNQMLDLDSNRNTDHVLHRESHDMSFFNPYPNSTTQDRNELLQSLIKGGRNDLPYLRQSEKMQPGHDAMMEEIGGQFEIPRHHHHHQALALDIMSQKRLNDVLYLQQQQSSIQDNSLFSIPSTISQEQQFGMSTPLSQPQLNQNNWFMVQNNTSGSGGGREVWIPSFEGGVGGISNNDNSDQSLYSVLSECNELRSAAAAAGTSSYDSMSSTGQYIQAHAGLGVRGNNYNGRIGVGIPMPIPIPSSSITATTNYNMLQQLAPNHGHHPLNYLSGHDPAAVATGGVNMLSNNISLGGGPWGLPLPHPQQNPPPGRRIHDSSMSATKPPFVRSSWNQ